MARRKLNQFPALVIDYFDAFEGPNEYAFLSNFYASPLRLQGHKFRTGEHAFQAWKAKSQKTFEDIRTSPTPSAAKAAGRTCVLRPDWERVKYDVMTQVVRVKFHPTSRLAEELVATGDALLVEGTYWYDTVWGVDLTRRGYRGNNWLGRILMARRAELIAGVSVTTTAVPLWFEIGE